MWRRAGAEAAGAGARSGCGAPSRAERSAAPRRKAMGVRGGGGGGAGAFAARVLLRLALKDASSGPLLPSSPGSVANGNQIFLKKYPVLPEFKR